MERKTHKNTTFCFSSSPFLVQDRAEVIGPQVGSAWYFSVRMLVCRHLHQKIFRRKIQHEMIRPTLSSHVGRTAAGKMSARRRERWTIIDSDGLPLVRPIRVAHTTDSNWLWSLFFFINTSCTSCLYIQHKLDPSARQLKAPDGSQPFL